MKLCFNQLMTAISYGLDFVERDLVGVATNHSKRVACLCTAMGRELGYTGKQLLDLGAYAVLHDNALTEYVQTELSLETERLMETNDKTGIHCALGERNAAEFPFFEKVRGAILYHHENADGSGPFGKKADEVPRYAAFIHLADNLDANFHLKEMTEKKYEEIKGYLNRCRGSLFTEEDVSLFLKVFTSWKDFRLEDDTIEERLEESMPRIMEDYPPGELMNIGTIFAHIVDYKSEFTSRHCVGISKKALAMADYYGFDQEKRAKFYLAGALHDIGKLAVDTDILEKPDKLTSEEFVHIQTHAYQTWFMLHPIEGFGDIARWASLHHEKLNGKGYPFGYTANQLGFEERVLACLDIYQALVEERPYKKGKTHEEAMEIVRHMAKEGFIDADITEDIDKNLLCQTN